MNPIPYFRYSVSLRISGNDLESDEISAKLNLINSSNRRNDVWIYKIQHGEDKHINQQLIELWDLLVEHKSYLIGLKVKYKLDVFCSYTSDCDHAGVEISSEALEIFNQLGIPFGLSIIVI
ncbi:DUF4279 domain-containing protein [Acidaminobacter sp. JC074]|uniref:DUF4279 domain-containing protein n=1 Tax=Acidaminobacter sp. JC074 TaxID=2530199 RepID=UPI001F0F2C85|nr:DUF4279 domain-containing protein [Acidaminobacter sp. JC074]MCH4888431.1 DUF4279 domain-containing protein [Acidaminobacter sp. JC074]